MGRCLEDDDATRCAIPSSKGLNHEGLNHVGGACEVFLMAAVLQTVHQ